MVGIYCIKNRINGKVYIGQSWSIEKRWYRHKVTTDKSFKNHLYSAIKKYGIENFEFTILKNIKENENTQKELDYYENYFMNLYNSRDRFYGYNTRGAGSHGRHSKESNEKNRLAHIGKSVNGGIPKSAEARRNMSLNHADISGSKNPMFGKKHSKHSLKKISQKAKLRVGSKNSFFWKHHSEKNKIMFKNKAIEQFGNKILCLNNGIVYKSINEAARLLPICAVSISKLCRGLKVRGVKYNFSFYAG